MRNNQPVPPISILPDEILTLIFSYLSPRELLNAQQVATLWQRVSNEPAIWRNLINQYFPYLRQQNQPSYQTEPKTMFTQEFQGINQLIVNHPEYISIKPYLFVGLCGDIEKIEKSQISDIAKEQLYIFAAANGHLKGLSKLKEDAKGEALELAAQNGYLRAFQMIFTQISDEDKVKALQSAAENGHPNVVKFLLTQAGQQISDEHKNLALERAVRHGHLNVTQVLLIQGVLHISVEDKGALLMNAALFGHLNIIQFLLTPARLQIPAVHKYWALRWAAENGHLAAVQFLLTRAGLQFSAEDKNRTLKNAAESGRQGIVSFLLETYGHELSSRDIFNAVGFFRASQFYASRTATALGNIWASFAPPAPTELPLPSMTIPSLPSVTIHSLDKQSTLLPMATQETATNAPKRKQESSPKSTNNELDSDDESPEIKGAKLR